MNKFGLGLVAVPLFFLFIVYIFNLIFGTAIEGTNAAFEASDKSISKISYVVNDISFKETGWFLNKERKIYIDTEQETLVLNEYDNLIYKIIERNESYIEIVKTEADIGLEKKEYFIYLTKDKLSEVSKKYSNIFKQTLKVERES